jgi:hypothetical protein
MRKDLPVFCPTAQAIYLRIIFARGLETRQHIGNFYENQKMARQP